MTVKMLVVKELSLPPANRALPIRNNAITEDNHPELNIFWDDEWKGKARGIIMFFAGGTGRGQIDDVSGDRPVTACRQGYIYVNCLAPKRVYTDIVRNNQWPVHNYYVLPVEVEGHLWTLFTNSTVSAQLSEWWGSDTPVVLCGTSRGGGTILQWSELSRGTYKTYAHRVVAMLVNAPAGSLDNGKYRDGYSVIRAHYKGLQCANHRILLTVGANDVSNMDRPTLERALSSLDNPNVSFRVIGDETYPHTWTYTRQVEWINLAISMFD